MRPYTAHIYFLYTSIGGESRSCLNGDSVWGEKHVRSPRARVLLKLRIRPTSFPLNGSWTGEDGGNDQ